MSAPSEWVTALHRWQDAAAECSDDAEHEAALDAITLADDLLNQSVVVLVVRDPDAPNDIEVHGAPDAIVIDFDLGYHALHNPGEYAEWAESHLENVHSLFPDGHPVRDEVAEMVLAEGERYRHPLPSLPWEES